MMRETAGKDSRCNFIKSLASIVVPVYASEPYIERCADSLVSQDYRAVEIIFIDDCSQDRCPEILDQYKNRFPESVKVIHHEMNRGLGASRNSGISIATGEFIGFVDADDWLDSRFVSKCISALERSGADIAATGMTYEYGSPFSAEPKFAYETANVLDSSLALKLLCRQFSSDLYMSVMVSNKIYRRSLMSERVSFFDEISQDNDTEFTFKMLCDPCKVVLVPDVVYHYAQHEDSMLHTVSDKTLHDMIYTFGRLKSYLLEKGAYEKEVSNLIALFDKCSTTMVDCLFKSAMATEQKYRFIASFYNEAMRLFPGPAVVEQIGLERIARFHGL